MWRLTAAWTKEDEAASQGRFDPRPVLMIHFPGQQTEQDVVRPFDEIRIHEMIETMLRGQQPHFESLLARAHPSRAVTTESQEIGRVPLVRLSVLRISCRAFCAGELHAAFLSESRTRGCWWCPGRNPDTWAENDGRSPNASSLFKRSVNLYGKITHYHNRAAAFPQPNPHKPIPLAISTKHNLIAILKKTTLLTRNQRNRFTPIASKLQQASKRFVLRPGHRATAQQITRLKIATIARMMGDQLCRRPIEVPQIAAANANILIHPRRPQINLQAQIDATFLQILFRGKVRERRRVLRGRAYAPARNGASASMVTTQGEMLVAKLLARNGPRGWYSHA